MKDLKLKARNPSTSHTSSIVEAEQTCNEAATTSTPQSETPPMFSLFKGLLLSSFSGVLFALCSGLVKYMKNIHPGQLAMYRFVAMFSFSLPQAVKSQESLLGPRELRFLLVLLGIVGATCVYLEFLAFRYLPLGEASVIILSVPIFVTIAARVFLKERSGIAQSIAVIITVVGVLFIARVPEALTQKSVNYTREHIYGFVTAFASLIFGTSRVILLRKLKTVHHSVVTFWSGWVALSEATVLTAIFGSFDFHKCGLQQGLVVLFGIFNYAGAEVLTISLQLEQAGPVSTIRAASHIILAFLFQIFVFQETPCDFSIAGTALVGFSVILMGLTKYVSSLPSNSAAAKRFRFLTM